MQVVIAGVNPGEIAIREGTMEALFPAMFPSGQGRDFACLRPCRPAGSARDSLRGHLLRSAMTAVVSWAGSQTAGLSGSGGAARWMRLLAGPGGKAPAAMIGRRGACPRILVRCGIGPGPAIQQMRAWPTVAMSLLQFRAQPQNFTDNRPQAPFGPVGTPRCPG